jgi:kynurenine formamidase
VGLIAVEPPSVADVNNIQELQEIHSLLLGAGIIVIEGLANLDEVTQPKLRVVAFPLKLKDGDGSPCRVILIEE